MVPIGRQKIAIAAHLAGEWFSCFAHFTRQLSLLAPFVDSQRQQHAEDDQDRLGQDARQPERQPSGAARALSPSARMIAENTIDVKHLERLRPAKRDDAPRVR